MASFLPAAEEGKPQVVMHEPNEVAGGRRSWDVVSRGSDGGASPPPDRDGKERSRVHIGTSLTGPKFWGVGGEPVPASGPQKLGSVDDISIMQKLPPPGVEPLSGAI